MKKVIVTLLCLGILGAGGYGVYHHFFSKESTANERVSSDSEDAVYVDLVSDITGYGSGNGLFERFGGEVEPQATLKVKLENDRTVKTCYVKEGDEVKEGQRLFTYDTREDQDKLEQAKIDIEKAEGDIEVSKKAIEQYEKEKKSASQDDQLSITTSILTEQNEIKRYEYEIKSNELEITQLEETIANATVNAEMAGIVQKISDQNNSDSYSGFGSDSDSSYMTILAIGDYRVKGTVNEQNIGQIETGMPMIIYSRVDNEITWTGSISEIKTDNADDDSNNDSFYGYGDGAGSSNYTFYVALDDSEGLMLGQHVYMEKDAGQNQQKDGLWLEEYYILEEDGHYYVWMANSSNVIEKHEITVGEYDDELFKYEILDGLTPEDYIAYPLDTITEGNPVIYNDFSANLSSNDIPAYGGEPDMSFDDFSDVSGDSMGMAADNDWEDSDEEWEDADEDWDDEEWDDEDDEDWDDEEWDEEDE